MNEAFKAFGLVPEAQLELEEDFFLWPENVAAFNLWLSVQTQWQWASMRVGAGASFQYRTGLNYQGVDLCIRYMAAPKKEKQWYFHAIQAMERAALDEWSRER